ncbi:MAG: ATP-binding cassette domain-containing protein [Acidimicrobiales bacterium]
MLPDRDTSNDRPLVVAEHVAKSYRGHAALVDTTFTIESGVTGLLGANGAGKTTLLGMIIGLHPVTSGTLRVLGHDPWSDGSAVRERLGYAPEHHTLPPDVKAADFVRHVAELHGLPDDEAQTRASDALWLVGLGEERFRPMGTMSTDSGRGSSWPRRSPTTPNWCSSTSRPMASTPSSATRCSTSSRASPAISGST